MEREETRLEQEMTTLEDRHDRQQRQLYEQQFCWLPFILPVGINQHGV